MLFSLYLSDITCFVSLHHTNTNLDTSCNLYSDLPLRRVDCLAPLWEYWRIVSFSRTQRCICPVQHSTITLWLSICNIILLCCIAAIVLSVSQEEQRDMPSVGIELADLSYTVAFIAVIKNFSLILILLLSLDTYSPVRKKSLHFGNQVFLVSRCRAVVRDTLIGFFIMMLVINTYFILDIFGRSFKL